MKILVYFFFLTGIIFNSFGQTKKEFNELYSLYEKFEYENLIKLTDQIISKSEKDSLSISEEVFTLQAASYFAINDLENSRKTFLKLLMQNRNYDLSELRFSPKIIKFYDSIKDEYSAILEHQYSEQFQSENNSEKPIDEPVNLNFNEFKTAIVKSVLIPGWGHLHRHNSTKGWILSSVSTLTLGSMIYYIFDTKKKEDLYLNATISEEIKANYNSYNSSYKIRNVLIITYTVLWLYSQLDLLFFNNYFTDNVSILTDYTSNLNQEIVSISFKIQF